MTNSTHKAWLSWRLRQARDGDPVAGWFGGHPRGIPNEVWPRCRVCGNPMCHMAQIDAGPELVLRSALRSFVGEALLAIGDERAVATLAQARREGESRGELWWMPETIRLQSEAARRFGDPAEADALLADAEALATRLGAGAVLERIAVNR